MGLRKRTCLAIGLRPRDFLFDNALAKTVTKHILNPCGREKFRHALHLGDERRDEEKVREAQEEKESVGTLVRQECSHQIHINIEIINNQFLSKSISIHSKTTLLPELFVLLIMRHFVFYVYISRPYMLSFPN